MKTLLAALCFFLTSSSLTAQTYLNSTGSPTFNTPAELEMGFVNLGNGNLHLEVPFKSVPQRGALQLNFGMVYDSRIWQIVNGAWQPTNVPNSMAGWRFATSVDPGTVSETVTTSNCGSGTLTTWQHFIWTDPTGTQREFPITTTQNTCTGQNVATGNAFASDSSGYHMYVTSFNSATVFAKNGNQVSPSSKDTNGNYFSTDANGNVIDTLGRVPATKTISGNLIYYDVLNSQGGTSRFIVTTETITVSTNFGQAGVAEYSGTLTAVQSIQFPDGSTYTLSYDSGSSNDYGLVANMTLRTGGGVAYSYTNFADAYGNINRWLNTRNSTGLWTYTPQVLTSCAPGTVGCTQSQTVSKPSGDVNVYTFTLNNGAWNTATQINNGPTTLLESVATTFDTANACPFTGCTGAAYVRPTAILTTDTIPGGSISKQVQFAYDSIFYGNVTVKKEWRYSGSFGTPDRETDTTYLATTGYVNKDILDRPTDVLVKGAGIQVADTKYSYDSTSLSAATGFSHHDDTNYGTGNTTRGNATQVQQWVSGATYLTTTKNFYADGQLKSVVDPLSRTTSYDYTDAFYNDNNTFTPPPVTPSPATHSMVHRITYPNSQTKTFQYYFGTGLPAYDIDENGKFAYHHYIDFLDRPTLFQDRAVNTASDRPWVINTYASATQTDVYTGIASATPSTGCSSCRHDQILLDGYGRKTRTVLVSDPDGITYQDTGYDSTGRTSSVTNPYRSTTDPTYGVETYQYEGLDRRTRNTHQDGNFIQIAYGANASGSQLCSSGAFSLGYPVLTTDESGRRKQTWMDGFGRTMEVDEPDSGGSLTIATCYAYDALNNMLQVSQGTESRTYAFDGLSRPTSSTEPESGTTATYYTTSGGALCSGNAKNTCRTVDARGTTTTFGYDTRDRLTSKTYSDSTPTASYFYDQTTYNGLTISNGAGRQTGMSDGAGQTAWSYDPVGDILTEKKTVSGVTKTLSNTYNVDRSTATKTYPSGNVITYTYSNAQRPVSVVNAATHANYATSASYAPHGQLATVLNGLQTGIFAGVTLTRTYNNRLQLTRTQATSSNGTAIDFSYSYDQGGSINNGSVVSETNNKSGQSGRSQSFTYDYMNRTLTAQTLATTPTPECWGLTFGYDRYGNLLSQTLMGGYSACSAPQFSVAVNGNNQIAGYTYDSAGNLLNDGHNYTYDAENRMTSALSSVNYTYDGDSWRVKKSNGELHWYDPTCAHKVADIFDLSGTLKSEYYYLGDLLIASRSFFYYSDRLDSVRVVTNLTGTVQFESDYYPFGGEFVISGTQSTDTQHKFTGKRRDTDLSTNFDYSLFRMYNSAMGRWLQADPVKGIPNDPQSLNRYNYVRNNAENLVDPTGGFFVSPGWCRPNSISWDMWGYVGSPFPPTVTIDGLDVPDCPYALLQPALFRPLRPVRAGTPWTCSFSGIPLLRPGSCAYTCIPSDGSFGIAFVRPTLERISGSKAPGCSGVKKCPAVIQIEGEPSQTPTLTRCLAVKQ